MAKRPTETRQSTKGGSGKEFHTLKNSQIFGDPIPKRKSPKKK